MIALPKAFIEKYQAILGKEEGQAFLDSFETEAVSGFRVNPLKHSEKTFADPIPSTPWGHYGKVSGKSIEHVTGLVYSQEPAAQMVGQVADAQPGMKVLDLAAAPGGKSTHLLASLNNEGLLISNEINTKRSKILVENIERFGARNVVVTNESADHLAKVFPQFFDLIVLDAPCSGEGMFRKDPAAIQYWDEDYPSQCARLQTEIVEEAVKMLAPKGRLVYSTCTWAPEENEEMVDWLLKEYPQLSLIPIEKINGMAEGIHQPETARMYPHHFKGEGQFVAHFQNHAEPLPVKKKKSAKKQKNKSKLTADQLALWQKFAADHLAVEWNGTLDLFGDHLYLLPQGLPDLGKLKIARNGLHLGTFKKNRFEPSFALGLALAPEEVKTKLILSPEQFTQYVAGQTLTLDEPVKNDWYQLVIEGNGLGFAKAVGSTVKNHFPKGLRFHS